jgi:hypothetical protein
VSGTEPLFGGPVGDWLAVLGVVSAAYWAWRLLAALIRYAQATPGEAAAPVAAVQGRATPAAGARPAASGASAGDSFASDLPVIVAAVAAMFERNRIVHIEQITQGQVWSSQGRWLHQTSHKTH